MQADKLSSATKKRNNKNSTNNTSKIATSTPDKNNSNNFKGILNALSSSLTSA